MSEAGSEGNAVTVRLPSGSRSERISAAIDRLVAKIARHWLAVFNTIVAVFVLLPFLAPVLMHLGLELPARAIYLVYQPTCHQLPERSFFLFGPQGAYSVAELEAENALPVGSTLGQRGMLRYVGNPEIGYKVAICERDVAIYGSLLLGGLIYGAARSYLARKGRRVPKLPVKIYLILLLPLAVDGITQLMGLRESTWQLRLLTGMLLGLATVWLAYPHIDDAMHDSLRQMSATPARSAQATP